MSVRILIGDCRQRLSELAESSVHCCVTSPPYFGLRDYGVEGQMGLEPTPDEFVAGMVEVFREVRRVLRDDGTLWLNIGDSYCATAKGNLNGQDKSGLTSTRTQIASPAGIDKSKIPGLKQKDLIGIPWALATALRAPYYTGKIKSELDRVWLAAMMDGEGSISGFVHERGDGTGTRTGVNVCLTNTCERMLAKAAEIWPASLVPHEMNNDRLGNRPVYRWKPNGAENVGDFLAELYPYLLTKKSQAALAWNLMQFSKDGQAWGKSSKASEVREKRATLAALISELNKGQSPIIPDWVAEPPSLHDPGWYLRQDIIWSKPNPMPESVRDRCTKAHEYLFLLSKSERYYYDQDAIAEPISIASVARLSQDVESQAGSDRVPGKTNGTMKAVSRKSGNKDRKPGTARGCPEGTGSNVCGSVPWEGSTRNKRSVWEVATQPFSEAHFVTYPPALIEPCILAGCPKGGTVLDPFFGAGTTGLVADRKQRNCIGIELNADYAQLAMRRIQREAGMFSDISVEHVGPSTRAA